MLDERLMLASKKRTGSGPRVGGCLRAERRSCSTGMGSDYRVDGGGNWDFQH